MPNLETVMVWKHLALGGYITGVNPSADPANVAWGETHPTSSFGGGYEIYYDNNTSPDVHSNFLRLSNNGLHRKLRAYDGTALVSPNVASKIDRKIDDGFPRTGYMFSSFGAPNDNGCHVGDRYRENVALKNCTLFWLFN